MVHRVLLGILAAALVATTLPAHGGQYQPPPSYPGPPVVPPGTPVVPPGVPSVPGARQPGPTVPGPARPGPANMPAGAVVTTGVGGLAPSTTRWQTWWEFNQRPFLQRRAIVNEVPVSGSDDFYLGVRTAAPRVDLLAPTPADLRDRMVPALGGMLSKERNRDIVTACMIALGKIGRDGPGVELEGALSAQLSRDDQMVRETAVLSLGIAGRAKALPLLAALLRDDPTGRRLVDRAEVRERTRAFAAYGLGLLAARSDVAGKRAVHDLLWEALQKCEDKDPDLAVAAISALGVLGLEDRGAEKMLLWQVVDELDGYFGEDRGRGFEYVQAHVPIAIGRLLGRGSSQLHSKCKTEFADTLTARKRRSNPVLQSCAIALGMMSMAAEDNAEDAVFAAALQRCYERGHDQNARYFALISLGRIGGDRNREYLLKCYASSNKSTERPWVALALGVAAFARAAEGEPDVTIARLLLDDLEDASEESLRGALAIAVGLTGHTASTPTVLRLLRRHEGNQNLAGDLCTALALLADRTAVPLLTSILGRSMRSPILLRRSAIALGQLGDRNASMLLLERMKEFDSVAVLSSLAIAIGRIGDRRSIEPLIELLEDKALTKIARGFVAAALGGVGDKDELPFNIPLTVDCNYMSAVHTLTNGLTGILDIL